MSEGTSTPQALSGRELARARRRALSQSGKAALQGSTQSGQPAGAQQSTGSRGPAADQANPASGGQTAGRSRAPAGGAASTPLSGREVARQHRRALARNGNGAVGMVRAGSPRVQTLSQLAKNMEVDCEHLSGREICRLRRQVLSQVGKGAFGSAGVASAAAQVAAPSAAGGQAERKEGCGCGCNGQCDPRECKCKGQGGVKAEAADAGQDATVDAFCETVESGGPGSLDPEVRKFCRERRRALANQGKAAVGDRKPAELGQASAAPAPREQVWKEAAAQGLSGREIARRRRQALCLVGSADPSQCLETGAAADVAPSKVEEGSTLSGGHVSGTQVDRTPGVTGGEPGTCRSVTGTEYSGTEQYETFCGTHPEPGEAKVGEGHTLRGRSVTGTEVGRSPRVTGDEYGACRAVTGTEYIGAEQYQQFCGTSTPAAGPEKVGEMATGKGERVSGNRVGRSPKVTGDEYGACRAITGTEYLNLDDSEVPCLGKGNDVPPKTGVTHTLRGRDVSGTPVGRSPRVTGDEAGTCQGVTGTEYLGAEQFKGFCGTQPAPGGDKVMLSTTERGQEVSGSAVGRSRRVTGDEPGSCDTLTGTQYVNPLDFSDLCERRSQGPAKVGVMHTLHGREVSGTQVDRAARVTGDEYGGCKPISGTEYLSAEHYQAYCGTRPEGAPEKVTESRTWNQQPVSGTAVSRSVKVTGDEYGACKPVTGTSYVGPDQYQSFCEPEAAAEAALRVPAESGTPGHPITGTQPGYDRDVTGIERGACQSLSGTPYVGVDEYSQHCAPGGSAGPASAVHPRLHPAEPIPQGAAVSRQDSRPLPSAEFSLTSPAREARERQTSRVTGTAYGASSQISGTVNKGMGLISGTPEFRYDRQPTEMAAPEPAAPTRPAPTGEGSEAGFHITGDSWQRGQRVTGTEGAWGRRNPTQRGQARGEGRTASGYKELERPDVPPSPITGSAGSSEKGPSVTVSGGARA